MDLCRQQIFTDLDTFDVILTVSRYLTGISLTFRRTCSYRLISVCWKRNEAKNWQFLPLLTENVVPQRFWRSCFKFNIVTPSLFSNVLLLLSLWLSIHADKGSDVCIFSGVLCHIKSYHYQIVPGTCQWRKFRKKEMPMAYRNVFETQKPWAFKLWGASRTLGQHPCENGRHMALLAPAHPTPKMCNHEPMNPWINEPVEWRDGWMNEWTDGLLLDWATSSLRHPFSQLLLLWAGTYLGYFCSELPPSSLSCSFCNPILLFAQRPAVIPLARSVAASLMLWCAQPCQCVSSQPVTSPNSRSVTPNRPTTAHRWQWKRFRVPPNVPAFSAFYV